MLKPSWGCVGVAVGHDLDGIFLERRFGDKIKRWRTAITIREDRGRDVEGPRHTQSRGYVEKLPTQVVHLCSPRARQVESTNWKKEKKRNATVDSNSTTDRAEPNRSAADETRRRLRDERANVHSESKDEKMEVKENQRWAG